jgi:hypothetical protein
MVRKISIITLVMAVALVGMVSMSSAAQNVANTSQKGSLLIFPKILVQGEFEGGAGIKAPGSNLGQPPGFVDTYITIGNDYFQEVWVKCYWVDSDQNIEDFMFRLTPNQPILFQASTGSGEIGVTVPPFGASRGELKCWAVNAAGDQQISFNHLYGNAIIIQENAGVVYNAWSFTARAALNAIVGTGGNLKLTGLAGDYDACPQYLVTNFITADTIDPDAINPDLTLVPCQQDLRQDRTPTCTKAKFDVWNANETKYTGAYQCLKCWYEGFLDELGTAKIGFGGDKFTYNSLHTDIARFRVQGVQSSVCKFGAATGAFPTCPAGIGVATPFLGVMLYAEHFVDGINGILPFAGYTPFGAGADGSGFVLWDAAGDNPEIAPK